MKFSIVSRIAAVATVVALGGCVVAPLGMHRGHGGPGYGAPQGAVYVAPNYATPGPGYAWQHHANFGWGWHHGSRGWHRGWR